MAPPSPRHTLRENTVKSTKIDKNSAKFGKNAEKINKNDNISNNNDRLQAKQSVSLPTPPPLPLSRVEKQNLSTFVDNDSIDREQKDNFNDVNDVQRVNKRKIDEFEEIGLYLREHKNLKLFFFEFYFSKHPAILLNSL